MWMQPKAALYVSAPATEQSDNPQSENGISSWCERKPVASRTRFSNPQNQGCMNLIHKGQWRLPTAMWMNGSQNKPLMARQRGKGGEPCGQSAVHLLRQNAISTLPAELYLNLASAMER